MPKIHFLQQIKIPFDKVDEWAKYIVGSIHEVSNDEAERWARRGVAEVVTTRQANVILKSEEPEEEAKEEIKTPEAPKEEVKVEEVKPEEEIPQSPTVPSAISRIPRPTR